MTGRPYRCELLCKDHDRSGFSCGVEVLDNYSRHQAGQDHRSGAAIPYVLVDNKTGAIAGFYTLNAYSVIATALPQTITRRLPKYPELPTVLIGRLAVDRRYQGLGVGRRLLLSALARCLIISRQAGAVAVVVDAKDEAARQFYVHHDFIPVLDRENRLFLPMKVIAQVGLDEAD